MIGSFAPIYSDGLANAGWASLVSTASEMPSTSKMRRCKSDRGVTLLPGSLTIRRLIPGDIIEGPQQSFSGRLLGGSLRVAGIRLFKDNYNYPLTTIRNAHRKRGRTVIY